jgi:hypothetical protein
MQIRRKQAMNQPASEITLSRVDEDAADKVVGHHDGSSTAAVIDSSDLIGLQAQRECCRGQQFAVCAIKENRHFSFHGR